MIGVVDDGNRTAGRVRPIRGSRPCGAGLCASERAFPDTAQGTQGG